MHKYKVYTGPTVVQSVASFFLVREKEIRTQYAANRLRAAGYTVSEGTEHVYTEAPNREAVLEALPRGVGWTLRDVQELS